MRNQWRIEDFSERGCQPLNFGQKPIIWKDFLLKTAWKWRKLNRGSANGNAFQNCLKKHTVFSGSGQLMCFFTQFCKGAAARWVTLTTNTVTCPGCNFYIFLRHKSIFFHQLANLFETKYSYAHNSLRPQPWKWVSCNLFFSTTNKSELFFHGLRTKYTMSFG